MSNFKYVLIFIGITLSVVMVDIDMTAMNIAIPMIAKDIGISIYGEQWIINGYLIAAASCMALGGIVGDRFGHKFIFLWGLVGFALASLLAAFSNTEVVLISARIAQGFAVGFTFPLSMSLIKIAFPENKQSIMVSALIAIAGVSQALGPTFGGLVVTFLDWRWLFWVNLPLCLASFFLVSLIKNVDLFKTQKIIPIKNSFIFILSMFLILTVLNNAFDWETNASLLLILTVLGVLAFGSFLVLELYSKNSLLDLSLLKGRDFLMINLIRFLTSFIYFSLIYVFSLTLQYALNLSAYETGFVMLGMTLAVGGLSLPSGVLINKIGVKAALKYGLLLLVLGLWALYSIVFDNSNINKIVVISIIIGAAFSLLIPGTAAGIIIAAPKEKSGGASGFLLTNSFIAAGIGVAISGSLMLYSTLTDFQENLLSKLGIKLTSEQLKSMSAVLKQGENAGLQEFADIFSSGKIGTIMNYFCESLTAAFSQVILLCVGFSLTAFALSFFLTEKK